MFTGIIQSVGKIERVTPAGEDVRISVHVNSLGLDDVQTGDSIAVNGVCLTVTEHDDTRVAMHVSRETLGCTVGLDSPHPVNLEKALRYSDRLGGHLVSGHVDGIGQVVRFSPAGECMVLVIRAPHAISRYIAVKGSIAVDGVSLTVNSIEQDIFSINLIPHTLEVTTLKNLGVGSRVNLEVDMVARYVERLAQWSSRDAS